MARRTKEDALATRDRILDAAEKVFADAGVAHTALHHIAEAAGVTRGAVYWHFKDKRDIFDAVIERGAQLFSEARNPSQEVSERTPLERVEEYMLDMPRAVATNERVQRFMSLAWHKVEYVDAGLNLRDRQVECRRQRLAHLECELKAAVRCGQISQHAPIPSIALELHSLVDGLMRGWLLDPPAFDLVETGRQAVRACLAGTQTCFPRFEADERDRSFGE